MNGIVAVEGPEVALLVVTAYFIWGFDDNSTNYNFKKNRISKHDIGFHPSGPSGKILLFLFKNKQCVVLLKL